jgi:hypothetical protein
MFYALSSRALSNAIQRGIIRGQRSKNMLCPLCRTRGGKGCTALESHDFARPEAKLSLLEKSPARCPGRRAAVVLDCEMVGIRVGQHEIGELVRLCAIDFLAREIVVDICDSRTASGCVAYHIQRRYEDAIGGDETARPDSG